MDSSKDIALDKLMSAAMPLGLVVGSEFDGGRLEVGEKGDDDEGASATAD
jgi:hypothetical protein